MTDKDRKIRSLGLILATEYYAWTNSGGHEGDAQGWDAVARYVLHECPSMSILEDARNYPNGN